MTAFQRADLDNNGVLSFNEFEKAFASQFTDTDSISASPLPHSRTQIGDSKSQAPPKDKHAYDNRASEKESQSYDLVALKQRQKPPPPQEVSRHELQVKELRERQRDREMELERERERERERS